MILLLSDYIYRIYDLSYWFRDIYRRYFLRNIPIISFAYYKEKIEIYTKYLEKKSNRVCGKYLRLHRWISQAKVYFAADFAAAKFSHNLMQLSLNGHNFFVSTPIHALFEALDS